MMLDPVTLKSSGAPVIHVHRQRHGDCAFGLRRPFAIALIYVQIIRDDAKLLASHLENFVVVNRVCGCFSARLGVHEKLLFALSTRRRQLRNLLRRHSQVRGAHASTRAGERVSRSRTFRLHRTPVDRSSRNGRFGAPPKPAREPRALPLTPEHHSRKFDKNA